MDIKNYSKSLFIHIALLLIIFVSNFRFLSSKLDEKEYIQVGFARIKSEINLDKVLENNEKNEQNIEEQTTENPETIEKTIEKNNEIETTAIENENEKEEIEKKVEKKIETKEEKPSHFAKKEIEKSKKEVKKKEQLKVEKKVETPVKKKESKKTDEIKITIEKKPDVVSKKTEERVLDLSTIEISNNEKISFEQKDMLSEILDGDGEDIMIEKTPVQIILGALTKRWNKEYNPLYSENNIKMLTKITFSRFGTVENVDFLTPDLPDIAKKVLQRQIKVLINKVINETFPVSGIDSDFYTHNKNIVFLFSQKKQV